MPESSNLRVARWRARRRAKGLRPIVLWLPDTSDAAYRARLEEQCRCLAQLTPNEAMADAFEREAAQTPGWQ